MKKTLYSQPPIERYASLFTVIHHHLSTINPPACQHYLSPKLRPHGISLARLLNNQKLRNAFLLLFLSLFTWAVDNFGVLRTIFPFFFFPFYPIPLSLPFSLIDYRSMIHTRVLFSCMHPVESDRKGTSLISPLGVNLRLIWPLFMETLVSVLALLSLQCIALFFFFFQRIKQNI